MHPISRPGFCGPRSPIHEWARCGPRRRTTICGTWPPNASPPIGITHLVVALALPARVPEATLMLQVLGDRVDALTCPAVGEELRPAASHLAGVLLHHVQVGADV